jgi:hypothetical protein
MSASRQPTGDRCGKWMPRAQDYCGRRSGHNAECRTAAALVERRERRVGQTRVTPEARSRWNQTYRLRRYGLTPERFAQMLEMQGYACAMCHEPFEKDQRICIDHDHACCPPTPGAQTRCCGKCLRGLLCLTCNVAVGYIEAYSELAMTYLGTALRPASPQPAGRRDLAVLRGSDGDGDPR